MTAARDDDLEDLYERAPCGYLSMRPDGVIVRANQTLLSWLDLRRDQVVGARFQDLLNMPGRIFHDTHYMPLLTMQGFAREIAFDLFRTGQPPLATIVTTTAVHDAKGGVALYRAILFESSSRRSYERELVQQRRAAEQEATARSALLAMLSHDVRSPLSSIMMAADLLDGETSETGVRYLGAVRRAATSMLALVNAILEHSRLEAGAAVWEPQPTSLAELISEIASIHSVNAETKGIELRTTVAADLPPSLLVDRYKLGQIVTNLLSNAIKFTSRGHVALELRAREVSDTDAALELRISDTGIGIAADKLETIFDDYKQATSATERRFGGTGLGLAISRRLAALAGGVIRVDSTAGVGSTFTVELRAPIAGARAQPLERTSGGKG
ncbi:MAG TPA: ATP-binding protein [Kofleriaceae bacterium]|nr:ATP-binding protein [Kofleriaceae bacterium]